MILQLGNVFLMFFGLDALLSVLDEIQSFAVISFFRNGFALGVLLGIIPVATAVALSRQLPARIFVPVLGVALWLNLGGAPLVLAFGVEGLPLASSAVQLAVAGCAFLAVRFRTGGTSWLLLPDTGPPPGFSALRFVGFGLAALVFGPPTLAAYTAVAIGSYAQVMSAGFLAFDFEGIKIAERAYQKSEQEIRLVGMMHIGDHENYESLFDSFAQKGTLVLEEGASDENELLGRGFSYEKMADRLGLSQQGSISQHFGDQPESGWPHIRNADIDTADLSPETIELLRKVGELWQADDVAEFIEKLRSLSVDVKAVERVRHDLIDMRNEHLLTEIESAVGDYPHIVVPWGALHMPWIEEQIVEQGFALTRSVEHPLVSWTRVREATF